MYRHALPIPTHRDFRRGHAFAVLSICAVSKSDDDKAGTKVNKTANNNILCTRRQAPNRMQALELHNLGPGINKRSRKSTTPMQTRHNMIRQESR